MLVDDAPGAYAWIVLALAPHASPEAAALLAEVDRFVRRAVEPRVARAEAPMPADALAAVLDEAEALGLAGDDEAPSGLGLWDELDADVGPATTLAVLARLARANAAVALALHQRALARALVRAAGIAPREGFANAPLAIVTEGRLGVGRTALARWLAGVALDPEDAALLEDVYAPRTRRVLPMDPGAKALLTLAFEDGGAHFRVHARDALARSIDAHAHGLDELVTASVEAVRAPVAAAAASPREVARLLVANALGLVAITHGVVARAHGLARAYAAQRRQGGAILDRHPAVLGLLGASRAKLDAVVAQLEAHGARAIARDRLGVALGFRAEAHPALADAAHAAMQVLGGVGYMRDAGLEKVSRDVNALRAIGGTPPELALVVAEWERLHG